MAPSYPSEQKHVLFSTQAPCTQGKSQTTIKIKNVTFSTKYTTYLVSGVQ